MQRRAGFAGFSLAKVTQEMAKVSQEFDLIGAGYPVLSRHSVISASSSSCLVTFSFVVSCRVLSCRVLSCRILPLRVLPSLALSRVVVACLALSCHYFLSRLVMSCSCPSFVTAVSLCVMSFVMVLLLSCLETTRTR
jgi:hypothetical protein